MTFEGFDSPVLSHDERRAWAQYNPSFLGGEYLPAVP